MPLPGLNTADKIIVDRRKPHRNSDVARAVRKTRDQLAHQPGNLSFDRELLKLHARAMARVALAIPAMVLVIAAIGLYAGIREQMLAWTVVTLSGYAVLALVARHADRTETSRLNVATTHRNFLVAHFLSGFGWIYFVLVDCSACVPDQLAVMKAIVLLLAIAATALIASLLRGALAVTFVPPVAAYILFAQHLWTPLEALVAGLLAASLPFFGYVAGHMNRAALTLLSFRSEKDALIAELDTAKSMSDEARRRAEEANLAKSRFLASMSHELRTPLNAILGFSEVMGDEVLGPIENKTYRDYARDIHTSGQHLLELINEILDLSRIEAGRYQLNEEPVVVTEIVEDCCHLMELKARNKDIRIEHRFEPDLPRLMADERAVRQIALNLLSNAVKFATPGTDVLVRVGWTAGGGQYISVKDAGPGIPEDEIPVVLSAFGQGSIAIKSAEQGTGLGLPIVQGLVALHGGEFELHSRLREGTEAIVIFPPSRVMEALPALPAPKIAARR
ncbi:sensor histidine kinase [Mesorhizobium sp. ZMM04-5]|uniref:histidine kinase n=1 Tax=Mesorhizobium marinum TaxID=3228790 RepID=A0ABV3R4N9_9HYPH